MVFEVLLTPPPYIKERIKDGERITNIMLVEFFDMPRTKKSVKIHRRTQTRYLILGRES